MIIPDKTKTSWDILRGPGQEELGNQAKALVEGRQQNPSTFKVRFQGARGSSARKSMRFTLTGIDKEGPTGFVIRGIMQHENGRSVEVQGYYGPISREGWLEPEDG